MTGKSKSLRPQFIGLLVLTFLTVFTACMKPGGTDTSVGTITSASTDATASAADKVTVVRARFPLHKEAMCTTDRLLEVSVPKSAVPPQAVLSIADTANRHMAQEVPAGQILRETDLEPKPAKK